MTDETTARTQDFVARIAVSGSAVNDVAGRFTIRESGPYVVSAYPQLAHGEERTASKIAEVRDMASSYGEFTVDTPDGATSDVSTPMSGERRFMLALIDRVLPPLEILTIPNLLSEDDLKSIQAAMGDVKLEPGVRIPVLAPGSKINFAEPPLAVRALKLIAAGWTVIEGDGTKINIEAPFDWDEPGERSMTIDTDDLYPPLPPVEAEPVLKIDPIDIMATWGESLMEDQTKMLDFAIGATLYTLGATTVTVNGGVLSAFLEHHTIERRAEVGQGWSVTLVPRKDPGQGALDLDDSADGTEWPNGEYRTFNPDPAAGNGMDTEDRCLKCRARSGDDWSQCKGSCPLPGSPHYDPNAIRWAKGNEITSPA